MRILVPGIRRPHRRRDKVRVFVHLIVQKHTLPPRIPIPVPLAAVPIRTPARRIWRSVRRQAAHPHPQRTPPIVPRILRSQRRRDRRRRRARDRRRVRGQTVRLSPPPTCRYPHALPEAYAGTCPIETRRDRFALGLDRISTRGVAWHDKHTCDRRDRRTAGVCHGRG